MTNRLFTPFIDFDHLNSLDCNVEGVVMFDCNRAHLSVSSADKKLFDQLPVGRSFVSVVVEDKLSGRKMEVTRANCGAGCFCAAQVVAIVE